MPAPGDEPRDQARAGDGVHRVVSVQDAGTEDQVCAASQDGLEDERDLLRALAAVGVDEHGDTGIRRERGDAGEASGAVAAPGLAHDAGARLARGRSRRVGRRVVDDDHLVDDVARDASNELTDHGGLVQRRDDQDCFHSARAPARARRGSSENAWSFRATAKPNGATSTIRAHHGMVHGVERKNVYAKATVPVNAISGADGVTARRGTSQTAYHGKTIGARAMNPANSDTA